MAKSDEQRLQDDLNRAKRKYQSALQDNQELDRKIEALNEVWQRVNAALQAASPAITPVYQTRFDSAWAGKSKETYNERIDNVNKTGNECLDQLRALLRQIRAKQDELRHRKNNLAELEFLIDDLGAALNYARNKVTHLGQ